MIAQASLFLAYTEEHFVPVAWGFTTVAWSTYFVLWVLVLLFWTAVVRMMRRTVTTTDIGICDVGRCTRLVATAAVVVVPVALTVSTVMALSLNHGGKVTDEVILWHTILFCTQALAWLMLSVASSCTAYMLFRTYAYVLGGCCAVVRTSKKVTAFLFVAVALWGSPASIYFVSAGAESFTNCVRPQSQQDEPSAEATRRLLAEFRANYLMSWWLGYGIGTFVPVLLFTFVMAERPGKVLDVTHTQSFMHDALFRPGGRVNNNTVHEGAGDSYSSESHDGGADSFSLMTFEDDNEYSHTSDTDNLGQLAPNYGTLH
jgi:hypothetical protein